MLIRPFNPDDIEDLIEILKLNDQFSFPEIDGSKAMRRVNNCQAATFLVCEIEGDLVGLIRGTYDGSRAMIHQLSIHPNHQYQGLGTILVNKILEKFKEKGATTTSATITNKSIKFWEKVGFNRKDVFIVGNW